MRTPVVHSLSALLFLSLLLVSPGCGDESTGSGVTFAVGGTDTIVPDIPHHGDEVDIVYEDVPGKPDGTPPVDVGAPPVDVAGPPDVPQGEDVAVPQPAGLQHRTGTPP